MVASGGTWCCLGVGVILSNNIIFPGKKIVGPKKLGKGVKTPIGGQSESVC